MNTQLALAPSAVRTTFDPTDTDNTEDYRSVIIVWDITAITGNLLQVKINGKDLLSGEYYEIFASDPIASTGTYVFHVGDGTADDDNIAVGTRLPRVWQLSVTHLNSNPTTYSIGVNLSTGPTRVKTQ